MKQPFLHYEQQVGIYRVPSSVILRVSASGGGWRVDGNGNDNDNGNGGGGRIAGGRDLLRG